MASAAEKNDHGDARKAPRAHLPTVAANLGERQYPDAYGGLTARLARPDEPAAITITIYVVPARAEPFLAELRPAGAGLRGVRVALGGRRSAAGERERPGLSRLSPARGGRMTVMERWVAYEQRKSDRLLAASQEMQQLLPQVPAGPVHGPDGAAAIIGVELAGFWWLRWWRNPVPAGGGPLAALLAVVSLANGAIWWLVFRRAYTVHVRTNENPPAKISVRLPSEVAAYRAAAQLASQFQADGPIALQRPWADTA